MARVPVVKIILLGETGVGKSALACYHQTGTFVERYDPTIEDTFLKQFEVDDTQCSVQYTDTAGRADVREPNRIYSIREHPDGILFVYSISNEASFETVKAMYHNLCEILGTANFPAARTLIGNKCDLDDERCVSKELGEAFAKDHGLLFYESSVKKRINLEAPYVELIRRAPQFQAYRAQRGGGVVNQQPRQRCAVL